ncbi:trace amine-associated receptor 1-like [Erpetoichthys calabaricus]|uniref:trace amine-associated receptor 1-like n=1 Tax=Erpetoichthys calabaricus TaxID=27687 RepID=UPI002234C1AD|nr:trace amine-associated receptor 1-like [Erpetoichthys calabaricus]
MFVFLGGGIKIYIVNRIMLKNKTWILEDITLCYTFIENSCPKQTYSLAVRVFMYVILCILITFTVCGNLLVIIIISHFKQLHTPTNYLTLSLAVADFLLGGLVMPPSMIRSVETCWYFGDFFCKFHTSTDMMLCLSSILHLSFISVDRYYAVCFPLTYNAKINVGLVGRAIFLIWCCSAAYGFGIVFYGISMKNADSFSDQSLFCIGGCFVVHTLVTTVITSLVGFVIPAFIILGIYLKIFIVAKKQIRAIKKTIDKNAASRQRERKAAKTLAIVIGVYITCWTPFFLWSMMFSFSNNSTPASVIDTLVWFAYINSTCNPCIYAFFYNWFRKALRMIVCGNIFNNHSAWAILYTD